MKKSRLVFLSNSMWTSMGLFLVLSLPCDSSFASRDCTQGPDCAQLNDAIRQIKDAKSKRHQDVHQYGKDSSQVKNDDLVLAQAIQKDHELRSERRQSEQGNQRHHSQHHSRKKVQSRVKQTGAHGGGSSEMDLTPM